MSQSDSPPTAPPAAPPAVPPAGPAIDRLLAIMARLRSPDGGCPWDIEQTFATIAPYTIEEAYEVADAIARNDLPGLKDELGDLLLQVVFHARMAEEQNQFDFEAVAAAIADKMIRRHPHVFGAADIRSAEAQTRSWEAQKAAERAEKAAERAKTDRASDPDSAKARTLDGVALGLPALLRAVKLQNRAARVGFDWPSREPVFAKLDEELAELRAEVNDAPDLERVSEEFGDVLFVFANLARHLKIDPEDALRRANAKFERRFRRIEDYLAEDGGRTPEQSNLEEMDALWNRAKLEGL